MTEKSFFPLTTKAKIKRPLAAYPVRTDDQTDKEIRIIEARSMIAAIKQHKAGQGILIKDYENTI